ncbi:MAG: AAA family ATPase [Candidatus Latescibacterota bacterium]|nr:MAG: AAA family ATPase [Candidatus Latescibacterota bacterium]
MDSESKLELGVDDLRWRCSPDALGFETTDDIPCCQDIIGQDRALGAIRLGLEITSPGYNIYVSGLTGTGKSTTIKTLLESMRHGKKKLKDICFVHNFRTPEIPRCIELSAGNGVKFKKSLSDFLRTLRKHVPKVFESDAYTKRQKTIIEELQTKRAGLAAELEKDIADKGFRLLEVQYGPFTRPVVMPVIEDQPVEMEKLPTLVEAKKIDENELEKIKKDHEVLVGKMEAFLKTARELDRELADKISWLEKEFVSPIVDTCVKEIAEKFKGAKVKTYLKELQEYAIDNVDDFKEPSAEQKERGEQKEEFLEFEVNLIVDNSRTKNIPVIIETSPSYGNLFGTIDRVHEGRGEYRSDLTMIRAGSLLRANGGFLVLSLIDIIEEPAVWPALKRALKNEKVAIQSFDAFLFLPTSSLKPEPIDVDVKVVLVGDAYSYQILYHYDEDFRKIFKVKADFDTVMPNVNENLARYGQFVKSVIDKEKMLAFHSSAVAAIAEEGSRIAGRQDKLTTRFSDVADVVREANYWAKKERAKVVEARHVEKAIDEKTHRVNLVEEKMSEMLSDGTILLDIDGEKIGQVNGLSVFDLGDYSFGKPSRITVETAMGRAGIINIEREADMSGKTHNKGVLIIEGYLRRKYAQDKPLTMSSSICFEQSYSGVDGDSASSTEIYAILSSLAELPLRQDLAVTGSVNQKGEIQPIGGVNQKIEGFFDICRIKGLTGRQGVIIPKLNQKDLMLKSETIKAIEDGKFHIYAIESIDEGIELLSGIKAGKRLENGDFEKDTVNYLVDLKLTRFAEQIKDYLETGDEKE